MDNRSLGRADISGEQRERAIQPARCTGAHSGTLKCAQVHSGALTLEVATKLSGQLVTCQLVARSPVTNQMVQNGAIAVSVTRLTCQLVARCLSTWWFNNQFQGLLNQHFLKMVPIIFSPRNFYHNCFLDYTYNGASLLSHKV